MTAINHTSSLTVAARCVVAAACFVAGCLACARSAAEAWLRHAPAGGLRAAAGSLVPGRPQRGWSLVARVAATVAPARGVPPPDPGPLPVDMGVFDRAAARRQADAELRRQTSRREGPRSGPPREVAGSVLDLFGYAIGEHAAPVRRP